MKKIFVLLAALLLAACHRDQKRKNQSAIIKEKLAADTNERPPIRYTDRQLEAFLDSVGHLPTKVLADKAAFGVDSIFKNEKHIDTTLSPTDFEILKHAARKGVISVNTASRILGNDKIDSSCNEKSVLLTYRPGLIPVVYYPFNKNKNTFDEFALCIGDPEHCGSAYLYFFKGRKIIAVHDGYDRDGLDMEHYSDADGKTIIRYKVEFDRGSGIWWYQLFFYKYDDYKLLPVLNIPREINLLQPSPWGVRELWFESIIQKTNPLTIKMVYHQQLPDTVQHHEFTTDPNLGPKIIDDSTFVSYSWNEQTKSLQGNFSQSKITQSQILSYYLEDNELLFINTYYKNLKSRLLDKTTRASTLYYLNEIKNGPRIQNDK